MCIRDRSSPIHEVLIEESLLGWKEFEMEVVRDLNDNSIIVCSIENLDPMGVHTGDSITVAPIQTLTDKEYQKMRNWSILCLRTIGVDTGGSNVQFAVNPKDGRMIIIEMNPRVSRSSALASKATGFPIAKIAARLSIGLTLDEIQNDITGKTLASFEPSIDYVVTKIPRFTFEKFSTSAAILGTSMKSVGEAMAIGRNFKESLQKALVSLETGFSGFDLFRYIKESFSKTNAGVGLMIMAIGGFVAYIDKIGASDALVYVAMKPLKLLKKYPYVAASLVIPIGQLLFIAIPSAAGLGLLLMASMFPITALCAGTKEPMWAKSTIIAF